MPIHLKTLKIGSVLSLCLLSFALAAQVQSQVIQGVELETFLTEAGITRSEGIDIGVTAPQKLTLQLNGLTHHSAFKSIDQFKDVMRFDDGRMESNFRDSWKSEVAAYQVDRMIGLGMVPATVERAYRGQKGSAQFWVDVMMSEAERVKKKLQPPNPRAWAEMVGKARLFDNLIYNVDRHLNNLLITKEWEIVLIDHSRAFREWDRLKDPQQLTRFSKSLLEGLRRLNKADLDSRLGQYLTPNQINSLLKRRDLILQLAAKLAAERGEIVWYP